MKAEARSSTPMDEPAVEVPNRPLALALIVLGVTAGVAFVWYYAPSDRPVAQLRKG